MLSISSSFAVLFVTFQIKTGSNFVNLLTIRSFSFRIKEKNNKTITISPSVRCRAQGSIRNNDINHRFRRTALRFSERCGAPFLFARGA